MRFFRKNNVQDDNITYSGRLAAGVENRKRMIARYMNDRTKNLKRGTLLYMLIIFCGLSGAICLYLIIRPFFN